MATVPSPPTFVATNVLTAAQMNTNVRDAVNFLTAPPSVVLRQSASQAVVTATWSALTFDTEDLDNDNMHSTVTNTSRCTAVTAGWYLVTASVEFASSAAAYIGQIRITDGTTVFAGQNTVNSSGNRLTLTTSAMISLAIGTYVQAEVYQASGGNLGTTVQGTTATNSGNTKMVALWVHS